MATGSIRNRLTDPPNLWPGFVDVLATLLIVIIFILMVFTVSQIYLSDAISGRDRALNDLRNQINELSKILVIESKEKQQAIKDLSETETQLLAEEEITKQLKTDLEKGQSTIASQELNISLLSDQINDLLIELKIVAKALETYEGIEITSIETEGLGEKINTALAKKIELLNLSNEKLLLSQQELAKKIELLNLSNEKLLLSQQETTKQLEIVKKLNEDLTAINKSLGLEDASLIEQLEAIKTKNSNLEELNIKLILSEEELQNQIEQYQILTEELITLNENLDLKDKTLLDQLELIKNKNNELAQLNENLIKKDTTIFDLRGKILELNNILSLGKETELSQQAQIQDLTQKLITLQKDKDAILESSSQDILEAQLKASTTLDQIEYLTTEIDVLKNEIKVLNSALEASEQDALTKDLKIEVLGEKLNKALTSKVFELQKYRSEFFGRLQELLGEREDIKVVGDRFIFESELLFDSASSNLQTEGKEKLKQIGLTLKETTNDIPNDIDWIIQVEGHTDKRPINTAQYPSNWELSTARANSVLKLLLNLGFAPNRLSAAGYGEFYPINQGESQQAFQENRRIELKLTSR